MSESGLRRATALAIMSLSLVHLACGAAGDNTPTNVPKDTPTKGTLVAVLQPRGNGRDADAFSATLDGTQARALSYDASITYDALSPGDHTVRITGIAPQCSVPSDRITHTVKAGVTDTVTFGMTCLGGFAYQEVTDSNATDIAYLTEDGRTIQLTTGPGLKFIESWSPDGTRLLYSKYENLHFHFYSVRADGTDAKTLTSGSGNEYGPQWSPDGAHIAYEQTGRGAYIAIADADGSNAHPLADTSSINFDVTWSTDGSRLYFGCDRFGRIHDICTAALDGSDLRAIRYAALEPIVTPCSPACAGLLTHAAASPDGTRIAFEYLSNSGGATTQRIWAASVDGTNAISLSGSTISFGARWSPSGDRMLLNISDGADNFALATVKADGSSFQQIVSYADTISSGDWSPDGKVIAYSDAKTAQIGVMNADGSNRRLLTTNFPAKYFPVWNPKARAVGALSAVLTPTSSRRLEQLPVLSRLRPEILRRRLHSRPERRRRMPRPARIVEDRPRQPDQVRVAGRDDRFRLFVLRDEPDGDDGHRRRPLHLARERHLIARPDRNLLRRREAAARHVDDRAPARLQRLRERDRLLDVPSTLGPVRARHAHAHRRDPAGTLRAPRRTPRAESASGSPGFRRTRRSDGWRAARGIRAAGTRARVQLHGVELEPRRALRRFGERVAHAT